MSIRNWFFLALALAFAVMVFSQAIWLLSWIVALLVVGGFVGAFLWAVGKT